MFTALARRPFEWEVSACFWWRTTTVHFPAYQQRPLFPLISLIADLVNVCIFSDAQRPVLSIQGLSTNKASAPTGERLLH
jgi:hypothetical protein